MAACLCFGGWYELYVIVTLKRVIPVVLIQ